MATRSNELHSDHLKSDIVDPPTLDIARESAVPDLSRRSFIASGIGASAALTAGAVVLPALTGGSSALATPTPSDRHAQAFRKRYYAGLLNYQMSPATHRDNGDETTYPDKIGSYSKGLPHNIYGEVDLTAYAAFIAACTSEHYSDFEAIPSGEPSVPLRRRLVNPMAGVAFDLEGLDSHDLAEPPAPAFSSAEEAGEIVENYWMALLRDVPFTDYATSPLAAAACADLSALSDFRGPKIAGAVTPQTLFRTDVAGGLDGPYLSQFFLRSQPFGAQAINPQMRTVMPGIDFMTSEAEWLSIQKGRIPNFSTVWDNSTQRYIRNGRDLSQWVHVDVLYQAYFQAALILLTAPDPGNPFTGGGLGIIEGAGNPYHNAFMQEPFGTFGGPYIMAMMTEVATRALKAVWFQKWFVHRRLRPETFAGRVHHKIVNGRPYPIHSDVLSSAALAQVFSQNGTYFLPQAFPEGSPLHPAYGAGHATVAGACITILKAFFSGSQVVTNPVVPASDGLSLVPYSGAPLTVEAELNKLAVNVAFGRNIAGVHWRTDGVESLKLGEQVAISILRDQRPTYLEPFSGFTFQKFDGTTITV